MLFLISLIFRFLGGSCDRCRARHWPLLGFATGKAWGKLSQYHMEFSQYEIKLSQYKEKLSQSFETLTIPNETFTARVHYKYFVHKKGKIGEI